MQTPIPSPKQMGTEDVTSWHARPHPDNEDGHELGAWLINAGDENDVWIEVLHVEYPKHVAEFIVESVKAHATRLRLSAALEDVDRERERLRETHEMTPYRLENARLRALTAKVGRLAAELEPRGPGGQPDHVYSTVVQVAALAVAWLEDIHANYGMPA